jgi:hypothetical protein
MRRALRPHVADRERHTRLLGRQVSEAHKGVVLRRELCRTELGLTALPKSSKTIGPIYVRRTMEDRSEAERVWRALLGSHPELDHDAGTKRPACAPSGWAESAAHRRRAPGRRTIGACINVGNAQAQVLARDRI